MKITYQKIRKNLNINGIKKLFIMVFTPYIILLTNRKNRLKALRIQKHYKDVINGYLESYRKDIYFAAYVVFDSTYGGDGLFKLMMDSDDKWIPKIVVIPDISRGYNHQLETYNKTKTYFSKRYGAEYVLDGWDQYTNSFYDPLDKFDIVYYANPYDTMVHRYHSIEYATHHNVLPIYISYGYDVGRFTTLSRLRSLELNIVWKCFADTKYSYNDYKKYQLLKAQNVVLAGYSKMDAFQMVHKCNKRKKILISSHHTVNMKNLPLSNFLDYAELILKLPQMFSDIDFVFRPHPLLFTTLINNNIWSNEKLEEYLSELIQEGIEYSIEGDYLHLFSECDAIINDCGSFTVEWLYTGKPGCFVYNKSLKKKYLTGLMNKAIESYTIAYSEQDIIEFVKRIENNCLELKKPDFSWVSDNITINFPKVSEFILKEIDIRLLRG